MKFNDLLTEEKEELKGSTFELAVSQAKEAGIDNLDDLNNFLDSEFSRYYVSDDQKMLDTILALQPELDISYFDWDFSEDDILKVDFGKYGTFEISIDEVRRIIKGHFGEYETTEGNPIQITQDDAEAILSSYEENWNDEVDF